MKLTSEEVRYIRESVLSMDALGRRGVFSPLAARWGGWRVEPGRGRVLHLGPMLPGPERNKNINKSWRHFIRDIRRHSDKKLQVISLNFSFLKILCSFESFLLLFKDFKKSRIKFTKEVLFRWYKAVSRTLSSQQWRESHRYVLRHRIITSKKPVNHIKTFRLVAFCLFST